MRKWFNNQIQNVFLYVPFLIAMGAALYFTMGHEPDLQFKYVITLILAICIWIPRIPYLVRAIMLMLFGFFYAATFTNFIDTPKLKHDVHNLELIADVVSTDYTDKGTRLYLSIDANEINAESKNTLVRVSLGDGLVAPNIGDKIRTNINLFQPTKSYVPDEFDYARWAYFNNLTATGYVTAIDVLEHKQKFRFVNDLRNNLHKLSDSFLVDGLVLGYKNVIPKSDKEIWTAVGIGHVWSISGFHMTLVGGWLFTIFMLIFRSIPYITRRLPARVPATICAWVGLIFYLFLSGIDVATMRAFLMTTLVFMAFIFGRTAISLRNVALVFCIIFLINPHYVMQAGFQLSFAAVFGLVWLYSVIKPKMPKNKIFRIIYAMILTTFVATLFTLPFVAAHFGAIPIYSIIGNIILLPIFSLAIMPLVMIGVIAATMGLFAPIKFASSIYDVTLQIAKNITDLPYATLNIPHIPNSAIIISIIGFMSLILIRPIRIKINYILFSILQAIAITIVCTNIKPIFMVTHDHELIAFIDSDNTIKFNKSRASNHYFAFDTWKKFHGQDTNTKNIRIKHDKGIYDFKTENWHLVYIQKFVPLMNNIVDLCNNPDIDYIVSYFDITSSKCDDKILRNGFVIYPSGRIKYIPNNRRWH